MLGSSLRTLATWVASVALMVLLVATWAGRLTYPYDLEWMEGGMLAHAWRMRQELPVYPVPGPEWTPYIYPPGYSAIVAALGSFVPLHPALGRVVSLLGTGLATFSLVHVLRRRGTSWSLAAGLAVCFLGTYPATGAFLDLVRPDGVYIGLVALSVALALDGRRGTATSSGLVLAAAFLVKHNAAAFGLPILLGLLLRDRRQGLAFAVAALVPALAMLGYLQWRTGGRFLTYLVAVPASHPSIFERFWPSSVQELGTALAVLVPAGTLWLVLDLARRGPLPAPLTTVVPSLLGMLAVYTVGFAPLPPGVGAGALPGGLAAFGVGAFVGWLALRMLTLRRLPVEANDVLVIGVLVTAFGLAGMMRAHNGGYLNVHLHLFWAISLAFGWVAVRGPAALGWAVPVQLVAAGAALLSWDLVPSAKDHARGDALVAQLQKGEGPVLSPFASWLPTYAGHPPSVHYMALWDLDYRGGPFHDRLDVVRDAVGRQTWPQAVRASRPFPYGLGEAYVVPKGREPADPLLPVTGWDVGPTVVLERR